VRNTLVIKKFATLFVANFVFLSGLRTEMLKFFWGGDAGIGFLGLF
jgi:hypothetical protein